MKIQRLGKQLKHEIITHPKKAILLGILITVGLYFWTPFSRSEQRVSEQHNAETDLKTGEVTQSTLNASEVISGVGRPLAIDKENKSTRYSWKEVVKLMSNDPRTRPAEPLTIERDPFRGTKESMAKVEAEDQIEPKAPPMTPASLGMTLTSTLIGTKSGLATIGSRTYELGQTIEIEKDGRRYKFILAEIQDRRVLLEMEGERFELSIPEPGASNRMVMGSVEK